MSERTQSEQIGQLATALAKAQGEITGARKESKNPFFSSMYADLASVWDACRDALSKHGLSVIQTTEPGRTFRGTIKTYNKKTDTEKTVEIEMSEVVVITTLTHESGEFISGKLAMSPAEPTAQAVGSCLTYARRYALAAIVGVAQIDDDANAASQKPLGDRSGRPDTSNVDSELRDQYVQDFAKALLAFDDETILKLQKKLSPQEALFTAVWDGLNAKQRAEIRGIIERSKKVA